MLHLRMSKEVEKSVNLFICIYPWRVERVSCHLDVISFFLTYNIHLIEFNHPWIEGVERHVYVKVRTITNRQAKEMKQRTNQHRKFNIYLKDDIMHFVDESSMNDKKPDLRVET